LNWAGDGYGDTQLVPDNNPVSVEVVMNPVIEPILLGHPAYALGTFSDYRIIGVNANKPRFQWGTAGIDTYTQITEVTHLLGVYDGTNVELFINGTSKGKTPTTLGTSSYSMFVGTASGLSGEFRADRAVDSPVELVQIHNRALTATEALEAYNTWVGA